MLCFRRFPAFVGVLLLTLSGQVTGAEIKRLAGSATSPPIIVIIGAIEPGDGDRFAAAAGEEKFAVVTLGSPGGNLLEGLRIGQMIRRRKFATMVPDGVMCASACGFAWLAGTPRLMQPNSKIGFHAAYTVEDGKPVESGAGNAIAGAYLSQLGLGYDAIFYVEQAHPDDITWLTERDARDVGIAVTLLPSSTAREPPKKVVPPVPANPPARSISDVARAFPGAYFSRWSEPSSDAIRYFSSVYGEKVDFYGTYLPLAVVIEQKRKFAQRWPIRVYSVRPKSLSVDCQGSNCKLTGVVDWDARTTTGTETTAGAATFSFGVHVSGETVKINAETGAVIQRLSPAP